MHFCLCGEDAAKVLPLLQISAAFAYLFSKLASISCIIMCSKLRDDQKYSIQSKCAVMLRPKPHLCAMRRRRGKRGGAGEVSPRQRKTCSFSFFFVLCNTYARNVHRRRFQALYYKHYIEELLHIPRNLFPIQKRCFSTRVTKRVRNRTQIHYLYTTVY